MGYIVQEIG